MEGNWSRQAVVTKLHGETSAWRGTAQSRCKIGKDAELEIQKVGEGAKQCQACSEQAAE